MDFNWDERDVLAVNHMWEDGLSIWDIARSFDRDPDEVLLLIVDQIRQGKIHRRPGGLLGRYTDAYARSV
jgi:hypothetical protein